MTGTREQFDTVAVAFPVPGRRLEEAPFDPGRLPDGVGWSMKHRPGAGRPVLQAAIPAAKIAKRDGPQDHARGCTALGQTQFGDGRDVDAAGRSEATRRAAIRCGCPPKWRKGDLRTEGTTGMPGVSVVIGRHGTGSQEWATVQVSSKFLHDREDNGHLPMVGVRDLDVIEGVVAHWQEQLTPMPLDPRSAAVDRFDSVVQFEGVRDLGRYVKAFALNKPFVRGGYHAQTKDETLSQHFAGGMTRIYNKHRETGLEAAVGHVRYEYERKAQRLRKFGVTSYAELREKFGDLDEDARRVFQLSGYHRRVVPVSDFVERLLWAPLVDPETGDDVPGFGPSTRRGALAHALLRAAGVEDDIARHTRYKYERLYAGVGVSIDDADLLDFRAEGETVFLDLHSQTERREDKAS